jgi:hypothetical protein
MAGVANNVFVLALGLAILLAVRAWLKRYRPNALAQLREVGARYKAGTASRRDLNAAYRPYVIAGFVIGGVIWLVVEVLVGGWNPH